MGLSGVQQAIEAGESRSPPAKEHFHTSMPVGSSVVGPRLVITLLGGFNQPSSLRQWLRGSNRQLRCDQHVFIPRDPSRGAASSSSSVHQPRLIFNSKQNGLVFNSSPTVDCYHSMTMKAFYFNQVVGRRLESESALNSPENLQLTRNSIRDDACEVSICWRSVAGNLAFIWFGCWPSQQKTAQSDFFCLKIMKNSTEDIFKRRWNNLPRTFVGSFVFRITSAIDRVRLDFLWLR